LLEILIHGETITACEHIVSTEGPSASTTLAVRGHEQAGATVLKGTAPLDGRGRVRVDGWPTAASLHPQSLVIQDDCVALA
jgi:hypothetical protein